MIKNTKTVKLVSGFVGLALALSFALPVSAATAADIQAQIDSLMSTIKSLQGQLSTAGGTSTTVPGYTFNVNLTVGSKGADVMNLQKVLNGSDDTVVALTGAGSKGMETSFFGPATKAAVIKFQKKYGISPTGYVGPITRAKLNSMGGTVTTPGTTTGTTTTTTLPTGGSLMVAAGTQPGNSLAPKGAARVPFTTVTLTAGTADVTVNSFTVQRSGLANDAVFAGVVVLDSNGMQVGIAKTLNSNHQTTVGDPIVIPAGTTKTFTIAGNMNTDLSSYTGQLAGLDVVAVNTTATVAGSLPITGAQQTINNSLTIGTASIGTSSYDPNSASSQPIGTTAYRFSGLRVTAGSAEDITLKSIRWNQTGSVGSTDLANVVTIVNGTSYPTTVSADGKYYSTVFPGGIVIQKGNSVDAYIQGDVVGSGAAGRMAEFDIYKNTDIYMVGNTYGYGVTAPVGANTVSTAGTHATTINTSSNPWLQGSTLSITAGSVTLIGKANEVAAQNIAVNVPNQVLGGFATNFSGEKVSVQSMKFMFGFSSASTAMTSVTIVDQNGSVVAGPVDATVSGTTQYVTFTDSVTFPIGRAVYTIKGKLDASTVNGVTIVASTTPSAWSNVTGFTTGNSIAIGTTAFSMNQMTVKGAAASINISAQPTSQTVVAGVQNFTLANYTIDASQSGEDLRLSSFPVVLTMSGTPSLTGCALFDGTTQLNTGSRVVNSISSATVKTFSFDNSLTVAKGTVKTLALQCNVGTAATGSVYATADTTTTDYNVTGSISGNTVTPVVGASNGGTMTLGSSSLAMSIDASSPSYAVVSGGATGQTVGAIKFHATNEGMNLTKVGLNLYTGSAADVITAYLYNGSTQVGSMQFVQGQTYATSTLSTPVALAKDADVILTVKADMAAIGNSQSGTEGKLVQIDPKDAEANGQASGLTVGTSAVTTSHVAGVRVFKSYPTVAQDTLSSSGVSDNRLLRFKVTASSAGPIGISQLKFTIGTSTSPIVTVTNVSLYAYTDSSYSSPVSSQVNGQFGGMNLAVSGNTFIASTSNPLQVPAGSTVYFQLYGSVTGGSASGASVVSTLLGDSAYTSNVTSGYYVATSSAATSTGNFIWSGNATSTAGLYDVDWSNSYGLPGFPSSGIVQTRSN